MRLLFVFINDCCAGIRITDSDILYLLNGNNLQPFYILLMYRMSSQAFANYSNTSASLRSTIQGQEQMAGGEREDDRKAFMQEMLQNSSQFGKERAMEEGGAVFANTTAGGAIVKAITGKDPMAKQKAAKAAVKKAQQALSDAKGGVDKEGIEALRIRSGLSNATNAAARDKAAASDARVAAQGEVDALPDAASRSLQTLGEKSDALAEAQTTATRTSAELAEASKVPEQGYSPPALQRLTDAQEADKAAQADVAAKQSDLDATTSARQAAGDAESRLTAAGSEERTAASAFQDASKAEGVAKDVEDVARAGRVAKAAGAAEKVAEVGEAADATDNPIGLAIGAITAVVAGILGSKVHVHSAVAPPTLNTSELSSYASTIGA